MCLTGQVVQDTKGHREHRLMAIRSFYTCKYEHVYLKTTIQMHAYSYVHICTHVNAQTDAYTESETISPSYSPRLSALALSPLFRPPFLTTVQPLRSHICLKINLVSIFTGSLPCLNKMIYTISTALPKPGCGS